MPNIQDATVVSQPYSTEGNGGRKLVRLDNGVLVCAVKTSDNNIALYSSTDKGTTWYETARPIAETSIQGFAIGSIGNDVHLIVGYNNATVSHFIRRIDTKGEAVVVGSSSVVDNAQTAIDNASLAINPEGTELHACWSSKNSSYNSLNVRYAKGTINEDGSVTWGTVEIVTLITATASAYTNLTIILNAQGIPVILSGSKYTFTSSTTMSTAKSMVAFVRDTFSTHEAIDPRWSYSNLITGSFIQSSPSAIFVPSEINGLPNGRIWVAWHGTDGSDTSSNNIRVSYSDDGGISWSVMEKLTSGNHTQEEPTITANKDNEVFVLWRGIDSTIHTGYTNIRKISHNGVSWGTVSTLTTYAIKGAQAPTSLVDFSLNFTEPLFIYQDNENNKIGFYGTWIEAEVNVTNKQFPVIQWTIQNLQDLTITSTKLFINDVEVFAENNPLSTEFSHTISEETLNSSNSMVIETVLSDGSNLRKNLVIENAITGLPLMECDVRYNFENTDGEIAEVVTWIEHDATCTPDDFEVTVSEVEE